MSCAIRADDSKLWCWGSSDGGALAEDRPPYSTCTGGRPDAAAPIAVRAIFEAERRTRTRGRLASRAAARLWLVMGEQFWSDDLRAASRRRRVVLFSPTVS